MADWAELYSQFDPDPSESGRIGENEVWATEQGSDMSGPADGSSPAATDINQPVAPPMDLGAMIDHALAAGCVKDYLTAFGAAIDVRLKQQMDAATLEEAVAKLKDDHEVYSSEDVGLLVATSMTKFSVMNERIAALETELAKARKEKEKAVKDATEAKKRADTAEETANAATARTAAAKRKAVEDLSDLSGRIQKFIRAEAEDDTGDGGGA